jgi:hypothetical protein
VRRPKDLARIDPALSGFPVGGRPLRRAARPWHHHDHPVSPSGSPRHRRNRTASIRRHLGWLLRLGRGSRRRRLRLRSSLRSLGLSALSARLRGLRFGRGDLDRPWRGARRGLVRDAASDDQREDRPCTVLAGRTRCSDGGYRSARTRQRIRPEGDNRAAEPDLAAFARGLDLPCVDSVGGWIAAANGDDRRRRRTRRPRQRHYGRSLRGTRRGKPSHK